MLDFLEIVEGNAGGIHGVSACKFLPTPQGLVAIDRIDFDQACLSTGSFARNQRRAASAKAVENEIAAPGAVQNGVGHQRHRLHSWMRGEIRKPLGAERVRPRVGPHVASVSPVR